MEIEKMINSTFDALEKAPLVLNNTKRFKHRCVYKICSRPIPQPIIADHLRQALKSISEWWSMWLNNKVSKSKYKIPDILINRNKTEYKNKN